MAKNPNSVITYAILESYMRMIATKCGETYSKKTNTITNIRCGKAIPTGSSSSVEVMCLICTYNDGSTVNLDATAISSAVSDVVSTSHLDEVLKEYLKTKDAYNPSNKDTLSLLSKDDSGNLLFNGESVGSGSSSGSSTIDIDSELSETSENAIQNKVVTQALKEYLKSKDAYNPSNKDLLQLLTADESGNLFYNGKGLAFTGSIGGITFDTELSNTSENAVQNKVITNALKEYLKSTDAYNPSNKDILALLSKDDSGNLLFNGKSINSGSSSGTNISVDSALSETSENAIQNKVVTQALKEYLKSKDAYNPSNKNVLNAFSDNDGELKYGELTLLTSAIVDGLISESDADAKYLAQSNMETDALDLSTL